MIDVHVSHVGDHDWPEGRPQEAGNWLTEAADGTQTFYSTEEAACWAQRCHRLRWGLDVETGEPLLVTR